MRRNGMMLIWMFLMVMIAGSSAWAQEDHKVEVSLNLGFTASDGVDGDNHLAIDGNVYNKIDPKDSVSWGLSGEYFLTENIEVGFLFDKQSSKLEIAGSVIRVIGDMSIYNYHGIFSYNFGEAEAKMRPFFLAGIGATHYGNVDFDVAGVQGSLSGPTKASATFGGGVKYYASPSIGVRLQARWTPTYITTDTDGWWCDPYWGCYVAGNAQYSNQFEFTGGINLRF